MKYTVEVQTNEKLSTVEERLICCALHKIFDNQAILVHRLQIKREESA